MCPAPRCPTGPAARRELIASGCGDSTGNNDSRHLQLRLTVVDGKCASNHAEDVSVRTALHENSSPVSRPIEQARVEMRGRTFRRWPIRPRSLWGVLLRRSSDLRRAVGVASSASAGERVLDNAHGW